MSAPSVNTQYVELSPMGVTFNGAALGGTSGGVKISLKQEYADITIDQLGKTPVDSVMVSQAYSVKMVLAETRNKDLWKVAFPNFKLVTSGPNKAIYADAQVGLHLMDFAAALVLHPQSKADNDLSGDFKFFKAVAKSAVEIEYGPDKQVGLEVEFLIYPDASVTPARYFVHGDPSIGLVAAIAGAPAFVGAGNGVLSALSLGAKAVTETITLECDGIPSANKSNWYISGSSSGALGRAQITAGTAGGSVSFSSNVINFTITEGTTDFVIGDKWTIAITGANYA